MARVGAYALGGTVTIRVPGPLAPGQYDLRVRAAAGTQIGGAHADVLVGGLLPLAFARDWLRGRLDLLETFDGAAPFTQRCQRLGRRRVDCALWQRRRCVGIAAVRLGLDAELSLSTYSGGRS